MIVNVSIPTGSLTLDFRLNQIRCLKRDSTLQFYDMSQFEAECYEYLYKKDKNAFIECLAEDATNNFQNISLKPKDIKL